MNLNNILTEIIDKKHRELNLGKDYNLPFSKIKDFEANAIGQIGDIFIKTIVSGLTEVVDSGIIHTEYDILTKKGIRFEIKTARKGRGNDTFQFNGINPNYNYDYLICLGICEDKALYRIFKKSEIKYIHKDRKHSIIQDKFRRQLVQMNPNNLVNFKLTLKITEMYEIDNILIELRNIL